MNAARPMHVRFREAMDRAALAADWRRKRKPENPYDHLMSMTRQGQSLSVLLYEMERDGAPADLLNGMKLPLERLCWSIAHGGPADRLRWLDIVCAYARAIDAETARSAASATARPSACEGSPPEAAHQNRKDIFG